MSEIIENDYLKNRENLEIQSNFSKESKVISSLIQNYNISCYIDFGCWYGFLLKEVLSKNPSIEFIALDAVSDFLEIAERSLYKNSGNFYNVAIKPQNTYSENLFRLDFSDTSKSGFDATGDPLSKLITLSMTEFFNLYPIQNKFSDGYLKLDMEGMDIAVLEELFALKIFPKVIHFEVLKRTTSRFQKFIPILRQHNYAVADLPEKQHKFFSIICSTQESIQIGFYPYGEYSNS